VIIHVEDPHNFSDRPRSTFDPSQASAPASSSFPRRQNLNVDKFEVSDTAGTSATPQTGGVHGNYVDYVILGKTERVAVVGGGEVVDNGTSLADERPIVGGGRLLGWCPGAWTHRCHLYNRSPWSQSSPQTFCRSRPDHVHLLIHRLKFASHPVRKTLCRSRHLGACCSSVLLLAAGRACSTSLSATACQVSSELHARDRP